MTPLAIVVPVLFTLARALALVPGLEAEASFLSHGQAVTQAVSAEQAATADLPASIMLGVAYRESGYKNLARPQCGVMQVKRSYLGASRCRRAVASALGGYRAGAAVYTKWIDYCRKNRRHRGVTVVRCALNAYAEGGRAGRRGWGVKCGKSGRKRCDRSAGPRARARRIENGDGDRAGRESPLS